MNTTSTSASLRPKPVFRTAYVQPRELRIDEAFRVRDVRKDHVRTLLKGLRISGKLDPLLAWEDRRDPEQARLVLLDGHHRLAAYENFRRKDARGANRGIPVRIVSCDEADAHLLSARHNSRDRLPLTQNERMDLAWRLVRACNGILSKAEIARDVGVGTTTIAKMRRRRREMIAAGQEPTGEWWCDAADKELEAPEEQDLAHEIAEHYERLKPHLGDLLRRPEEVQWGVLERLLGTHKLRHVVEWGIGDGDDICRGDEWDVAEITTNTTAAPQDDEADDF